MVNRASMCGLLLPAALAAIAWTAGAARGEWPTGRGSAQRTGCLDGQAGPASPAVRWVYKAQENYVASPLLEGGAVYFPALGPFNTGLFHCLTAQDDQPRLLWSKQAPFIKRPLVCSPVASEGLLIFGDGMHQTDDAVLYCVMADTGRPVWQYPLPGKLVHLEAAPTIDRGRVYTGGGAAGVLCIEAKLVVLDGKEMDLAASQAIVEQRWKELVAEAAKAGTTETAYQAGPNEEALPKPAPRLVWQKGRDVWHVDAPVAVAGDSVLACSAFLDEEKIGKRALLCLRAADGGTVWEVPLDINPWAGVTVMGHIALAGCSSIRFDPDLIPKAEGEVVAADLATGRVVWRRKLPGGVLSSIAAAGGLAVFTATDGRLRAWRIETGEEQWQYDAGRPFFAGPAVAGGVVYAADLAGVLHAVKLADGRRQWKFGTVNAAGTQLPGMVYGSPAVHRGRIYLATCNVQGENAGKPSMVVCIDEKQAVERGASGATLQVDRQKRTVSIPCRIAPRKLPTLADIYPLEVIACFPSPLGLKAHETVVVTEVKPSDLHRALVELGLRPGAPIRGDTPARPAGSEVSLAVEITDGVGKSNVVPIEEALVDERTGRSMPPLKWYFTGSVEREPAEAGAPRSYAADMGGTLVTLFPVTDETVIQSGLSIRPRATLRLDTNKGLLPAEGAEVRLIVSAGPAWTPVALGRLLEDCSPFSARPTGWLAPRREELTALLPVALGWQPPEAALRAYARAEIVESAAAPQFPVPEHVIVPAASATPLPPVCSLPAGPPARTAASDPALPPALPAVERVDPGRQGWGGAGARDRPDAALPGEAPELRRNPTAFVRLAIPEPSGTADAVRPGPLPDDAPPVPFGAMPGRERR